MRKFYYVLTFVLAVLLAFAGAVFLWTQNTERSIKNEEVFGIDDLSDIGTSGKNISNQNQGKLNNDLKSLLKNQDNIQYQESKTDKNDNISIVEINPEDTQEEKYILEPVYDLPVVSVGTNFADKKIVFTEKVTGASFGKDKANEQNLRLSQNLKKNTQRVFYGKSILLKEYLDDELLPLFDLEFVFDKTKKMSLPANYIKCVSVKSKNEFFCEKLERGGASFIITRVQQGTLQEDEVYKSRNIFWELDSAPGVQIIYQSPSETKEGVLILLKDKKAKVLSYAFGLDAKLSKDGNKVLYSALFDGKRRLVLLDLHNNERQVLPFSSFAQKCAFLTDKILCAVPKDGDMSIDDWLLNKKETSDEFWIYNIKEKNYFRVPIDLLDEIDTKDMHAEMSDEFVIFINKKNSRAYALYLPKTKKDINKEDDEKGSDK